MAFAEATRILFRIIQTTHHLQNPAVSGGRTTPPASLQKKMQELATLILEEHYLGNLGHLTKKLENIHLPNLPEAFQVATKWAKKKFAPDHSGHCQKNIHPLPHSQEHYKRSLHKQQIFSTGRHSTTPTHNMEDHCLTSDQYQREWPALRQTYPPGNPAPARNAERTVLPQEAPHHQRNRIRSGIAGHYRDWEPEPLLQRPLRTTWDRYNSGSTPNPHPTPTPSPPPGGKLPLVSLS
ncbi:hypothetical protein SKAU_G00019460 [Synaphobranchus kaupii]|uniref:Uncharacterized protein n=1 Tax=Synaphobranchus kaupii TaxID=118154 RepID=A0A9Q1GCN8_SYNKA|nr:hypothetical protein SKAU_G00019460 [Synaphobranchus kaupii]